MPEPFLDLLPDSAAFAGSDLQLGGIGAESLANELGTPLVVVCEETVRARARVLRAAAGEGRVFFGSKAFPNVALLRLLREEGIGADVAATGELAYARAAGLTGAELVVHGNNKDAAFLAEAAREGAPVVLDAPDEAELAADVGVQRVLVRVTLGVDADTHEAVRTGHHGSKFGLPPEQAACSSPMRSRAGSTCSASTSTSAPSSRTSTPRPRQSRGSPRSRPSAREELGWVARVADLGGGFGIRHHPDDEVADAATLVSAAAATARTAFSEAGLPEPEVWLEPGRCLVGRAGVTLYRVGSVKRLPGRTWVAVDGGMSDNPRPQLYGARYTALSATRADEPADEVVSVAGMHCESGDVLIDDVALPAPRRGDLLAVPATGAYTLAMASNYNGVTRPAAVLVGNGSARVIRRRESVEDLLRHELR